MANIFYADDGRVPRLQKPNFVSVADTVIHSINEKDIDVKIMYSEKFLLTDVNTME